MHDSFFQIDQEASENNRELLSESDDSLEEDHFEPIEEQSSLVLIEPILVKIRSICRYFKKSGVKNDFLQKLVKEKHGKELSLLIDCKTRWNSIPIMADRYLLIKDCVDQLSPTTLSEDEINTLKVILIKQHFILNTIKECK